LGASTEVAPRHREKIVDGENIDVNAGRAIRERSDLAGSFALAKLARVARPWRFRDDRSEHPLRGLEAWPTSEWIMEPVTDLLFAMRIKGAKIWSNEGLLLYDAPRGALSPSDIEILRARKQEIVALLNRSPPSWLLRTPPLGRRLPSERVPLTPLQWSFFRKAIAAGGVSKREAVLVSRLRGPLDISALRQALRDLIRRHEILNTRIVVRDGVPLQETAPVGALRLEPIEMPGGSLGEREKSARSIVGQLVAAPTDMAKDPLFVAELLVLDERDHVLLIAMDPIAFDPGSIPLLQRDLCVLYARAAHGKPAPLPPVSLQFADYAVWQQKALGPWADERVGYWVAQLSGARRLTVFSEDGPTTPRLGLSSFRFDQALTAALRRFSLQHRTTLLMSLLTAYVVTLSQWCGTPDLTLQVPPIARRFRELQHTVGPLGTVLYLRVRLRPEDRFLDLLLRVVADFNAAYEHDDGGKVVADLPRPPFASNPRFNFISQELIASIQPDLGWSYATGPDGSEITVERFEVDLPDDGQIEEPFLRVVDRRDHLVGLLSYRAQRVMPGTIHRFEQSFRFFVQTMMDEPTSRLPRLPQTTIKE